MTEYRRFFIPKAMSFFTVNFAERKNNHLLTEKIDVLREAFRSVKQQRLIDMNAVVIMPDHLHCVWTLPENDGNYSVRGNLLKGYFSRHIPHGKYISKSRRKRRERGLWQRRFRAHLIEDQEDLNRHIDYIHRNPVKHDHLKQVMNWPYSSFHPFVERGMYLKGWGGHEQYEIQDIE